MKTLQFSQLRASVDRTRKAVDVSNLDDTGRLAVATFARKWADFDQKARQEFLDQIGATTGATEKK